MKYPKEYLDEIKIRLKVSQVVGQSVKLKKRGKEFIGLSPFSNEKTPSFTVNDEKGFYHCFSSAEHGNIFDFLMKTKNYKFGEAVRTLASDAGMQPYRFTKQDEEKENRRKIYALGLDVYKNEPKLNPGYLNMKNVFILPHLGSATKETRTAMANLAIDNLDEFFKTGNCKNKVN